MLQGVLDEGTQMERSACHADAVSGDAVGHLQFERDEVEFVNVLPVAKSAIDLIRVAEETDGVHLNGVPGGESLPLN